MRPITTLLPASLARRFALAAAGLAAVALLLTSSASWWLINRQHQQALEELADLERQFHATAFGSQLQELAARMNEVAGSTILASGLVDSAGRETYLAPFLAGIRQVNGVPVQVLFTDFEGQEIASNGQAQFSRAEVDWLRRELENGRANSIIMGGDTGSYLLAFEPMVYARTASPEGALLYKVALKDVHIGPDLRLAWGAVAADGDGNLQQTAPVPVPAIFSALQLRVQGSPPTALAAGSLTPQYLAIVPITIVLFAGVVVAGVALARLLTRDLRQLQAFSSQVITRGLSAERASVDGSAEVTSLAASFNQMLDRLHEQQSALVREREKLTDLADALKTADRRKDEFLAMLAHELRNPLAPITYSLELIKRGGSGDSTSNAQARAVMERQLRHLVRLVDDLLDVSRITRGKLELRKESVDLSNVIDQAVEACRAQIDAAGHELHIRRPSTPLHVDVDPVRLVQVLANLLNNAAKYTERGGRIELDVSAGDTQVEINVRDTGVGIEPHMIERVFELFTRGGSAEHVGGGLGIGLTLAKRLVELHNGKLTARSDGRARGSVFTVRLPRPVGAVAASTAAPQNSGRLAIGRVLVVDDNRDAAASLAALLALTDNEVRIAYDGEQALTVAAEYKPHAILLDIGLPHMNGYDVCRVIRSEPGGERVFIVAVTGWGQEQDRLHSQQAGFDAHLVKPADYDTLVEIFAQRDKRRASAS